MSQSKKVKAISVAIRNGDDTKVSVSFKGAMFTPEEFTSVFMGVLEEYTKGMIAANGQGSEGAVYDHWNRVFGIFLSKILPESKIYERDPAHKELKERADAILRGGEADPADRMAAVMLCRDILTKEVGMDEASADLILDRRLGLMAPKKNAA
jgi:hypothetical protein